LKIYFIRNIPAVFPDSRFIAGTARAFIQTRWTRVETRSKVTTGEEGPLINLLTIPIDRKSLGYKEKRAFPPGGTETLDSFPRARKANLTNVAATMHRNVTSEVAVVPTLQENASSQWFVHKSKWNDETRLLTVCFLSGIYVNPFARSSKYIINVRERILLADLNE